MNKKIGIGNRLIGTIIDTFVFVIIFLVRFNSTYHESGAVQYGSHWYDVASVESPYASKVIEEPFFIVCIIVMAVCLIALWIFSFKKSESGGGIYFLSKIVGYIAAILAWLAYNREDGYFLIMLLIVVVGFVSLAITVDKET